MPTAKRDFGGRWRAPNPRCGGAPGRGRCGAPAGSYLSRGCRRPRPAAARTPAGVSSLPRRSLESTVHKSWREMERKRERQTDRAPPLRTLRTRAAAGRLQAPDGGLGPFPNYISRGVMSRWCRHRLLMKLIPSSPSTHTPFPPRPPRPPRCPLPAAPSPPALTPLAA